MPSSDSKGLTKKQAYWLKHLQEGKASGRPLATYARSQGLRPAQFHSWSTRLRALGVWESSGTVLKKRVTKKPAPAAGGNRPTELGFIAARVATDEAPPLATGMRISFPNGIMLEVGSSVQTVPDGRLLFQLAALP